MTATSATASIAKYPAQAPQPCTPTTSAPTALRQNLSLKKPPRSLDGVLNVTVRHMPLNMHANAVPAALAVEAAEAQGKHVEMANKLFAAQNDWKNIKERDKLRTSSMTTPRNWA